MHFSRALAIRRALTAQIHPQLPLDPRQSKQLLNLLITSFRQQLDEAHPQILPQSAETQVSQSTPSSQASADKVFQSVLSNPLFLRARQRSFPSDRTPSKTAFDGGEIRKALSEPVGWFEDRIAQGIPSMDAARMYLAVVSKIPDSPEQAQYKYHAATVLRDWLWSTGLEESLDFVGNDSFTKNVVYLMVSTGFEKKIWAWIRRLDTLQPGTSSIEQEDKQAVLLVLIANARLARFDLAESALSVLFDALDLTVQSFIKISPVARLYNYLRRQICNGVVQPKSPTVFERFLRAASRLTRNTELCYAELRLVHPKDPDAAPAVSYIRKRLDSSFSPTILAESSRNMKFVLDTAQVLLHQENYQDASRVMALAREVLSEKTGLDAELTSRVSSEGPSSPSEAEIANLELLDRLSPG